MVYPVEFDTLHFFIFLFLGLVLGSFATALTHRIPQGKSWGVSGATDKNARRSSCPHCGYVLGIRDLVPFFSWALQRGKCRYCQKPISKAYPAIELATATIILLSAVSGGLGLMDFVFMISVPFFVAMMAIDLKYKILPNQLVLITGIIGVIYLILPLISGQYEYTYLINHMLGMIVYPLLLWGTAKMTALILKKETLGFGDVKLFAVCGLWVGLSALAPMMILSGLIGVVMGIFWLRVKGENHFPFGPAIIVSLFVMLLIENSNGEFFALFG